MSDLSLLRLSNFNKRFRADEYGPVQLAKRFGRSASFWSDLRAGRKSFGEKLARSIEELGQLVPGSLDDPEGVENMPIPTDIMNRLARLSDADRAKAIAVLRAHLGDDLEGARPEAASGKVARVA